MTGIPSISSRSLSLIHISTAVLLPLAALLLLFSTDGVDRFYLLGNWPTPFGIVLVLDRLSALFLLLTALVALPALCYAMATDADYAVCCACLLYTS